MINPYLDSLIDPSFRGANRLFVVQFENVNHRTVHTEHFLLITEIISRQKVFNEPVQNNLKPYDSIKKKVNMSRR